MENKGFVGDNNDNNERNAGYNYEIEDKENGSESDSESEPSRDNLDEEQIKILLPFCKKKKISRKSKKNKSTFKYYSLIKNKQLSLIKSNKALNHENRITNFPKIDSNQTIITKINNKILTVNHILYNNIQKQNINLSNKCLYGNKANRFSYNACKNIRKIKPINKEDKQTQIEEKFFKFHWSTFFGIYKILSPKFDDKKMDESFTLIAFERKLKNNNLRNISNNFYCTKFLSTIASFNCNIKENKNNSKQIFNNSSNSKVNKLFKSEYYELNLTKFIKKNNKKIAYSSDERINQKNYIKNKKREEIQYKK